LYQVRRFGDFLVERLAGTGLDKRPARTRANALQHTLGLSDPERRVRQRPAQQDLEIGRASCRERV
ncbi:ABC transporter ATP-binding protein, partial [Streptomyces sp. BE147]|nr:ABC transporter ATP-binding protein [Streptomyces sp. BE147]